MGGKVTICKQYELYSSTVSSFWKNKESKESLCNKFVSKLFKTKQLTLDKYVSLSLNKDYLKAAHINYFLCRNFLP